MRLLTTKTGAANQKLIISRLEKEKRREDRKRARQWKILFSFLNNNNKSQKCQKGERGEWLPDDDEMMKMMMMMIVTVAMMIKWEPWKRL